MENIVKEFRLGELFCGPGGLALGATTAEIEDPEYKIIHKWANDYIRIHVILIREIYVRKIKRVLYVVM